MVPWWTLILLTAGFFIREVIMRSRVKLSNYNVGYLNALSDMVHEINHLLKQGCSPQDTMRKLNKFIGDKANEMSDTP